ncbi:MAG: shikimate dehydrogenase family protein [Candidatus Dormibacteria bacterium]
MSHVVGLVGDPIGHSLSPAIHGAAFTQLGLDWEYRLLPVPRGSLEAAWPGLARSWRGFNVTTPHKLVAARLVQSLTPTAKICASVNTVTFQAGRSLGDSTDGQGFLNALDRGVDREVAKAVILGTGGVARSVASALAARGAKVSVVGRNQEAGHLLVQDLSGVGPGTVGFGGAGDRSLTECLAEADLLVNATSLGGPLYPESDPVSAAVQLAPDLVVFDLVYWPRDTPLRRRVEGSGGRFIDGLEMLVEQAALAFSIWTEREAPLGAMRQAAQRAVAAAVE